MATSRSFSHQVLSSYRNDRLGLTDSGANKRNEILYHLMELNVNARIHELSGLVSQASPSLGGSGPQDIGELKSFLEIASAMTVSSRKRSRNSFQGTASGLNFKKMSKKPFGDSFDPDDAMEDYVRRAEAIFSHTVSKSQQLRSFDHALNAENIIDNIVIICSPDLEHDFLSRKSKFSSVDQKKERLLFYSFYVRDVDTYLSTNFDVNKDGIDALTGIPFSESPSLTIGHGASGLLLCRVLLGQSQVISRQDILAGRVTWTGNGSYHSVTFADQHQNNFFIVEKADQVLPYCFIHLKDSLTAATVTNYMSLSASGPVVNGVNGTGLKPVGANLGLPGNFGAVGSSHAFHSGAPAGLQGVAAAIPGPSISNGILHQQLNQQNPQLHQNGVHLTLPRQHQHQHQHQQQQQQQQQHYRQHGTFIQILSQLDEMEKTDNCTICTFELGDSSIYDNSDTSGQAAPPATWIKLKNCGHILHELCFGEMTKGKAFFQCPQCKKYYGEKTGTQPCNGHMNIRKSRQSLAGYEGSGTIEIFYEFSQGVQGPEHPHPGKPYHPIGFPRTAYLPDNAQGQKVLKLLQKAFERRLIFTVGRSATNGMDDAVTWNDIHHKTSTRPGSTYGYPDPAYLNNVLAELAQNGVVDV